MDAIKTLAKWAAVGGVLILLIWGVKVGVQSLFHSVEESNTAPTEPAAVTREFFTALSNQDYDACYASMMGTRKLATMIGKASREEYIIMFRRVRDYLTRYAGANFLQSMQVPAGGGLADFGNDVQLRLKLTSNVGPDKLSHYAIADLADFPMDVAPVIGVEQYNRTVDMAANDIDSLNAEQPDNAEQVIRMRAGEGPGRRLQRMIANFHNARHLDTRHAVLEWIIREFPTERNTANLLAEVSQDTNQPPQLRKLAYQTLSRMRQATQN